MKSNDNNSDIRTRDSSKRLTRMYRKSIMIHNNNLKLLKKADTKKKFRTTSEAIFVKKNTFLSILNIVLF